MHKYSIITSANNEQNIVPLEMYSLVMPKHGKYVESLFKGEYPFKMI